MPPADPNRSGTPSPHAFELLGITPRAALDPEEVDQAFNARAPQQHPDSNPTDQADFAALGTARQALKSPAQRLDLLLQANAPSGREGDRGSRRTVTLSAELNELFTVVGAALEEARTAIARRDAATSELARALVTPQLLQARQKLITAQQQVRDLLAAMNSSLPDLDKSLDNPDPGTRQQAIQRLSDLQGQFACLERWHHQLRQQTAACMF